MRRLPLAAACVFALILALVLGLVPVYHVNAATQAANFRWERETGCQKLTPTTSTALTIPAGTTNAEFYIESGPVFVRWNGSAPVDGATSAMKWPEGHFRKEENDAAKLSGLRLLCADCVVWVNYSRERRLADPVP
jgi:hypothetical protein